MQYLVDAPPAAFIERRHGSGSSPQRERRQFANSHEELSPAARELATAVDEYKLCHRRRFVTYEEILGIITELGYEKRL